MKWRSAGKIHHLKLFFFVTDSSVDLQLATYYGQWYLFYDSINDHKNLLCWRSLICEDGLEMMLQYFNHCVHIVSYKYGTDGIWRKSEKWDKNQMQNFAFCSWRRRNAFSWAERKFSLFSQQPTFVNWKYLSRDLYLKFYSCSKWK